MMTFELGNLFYFPYKEPISNVVVKDFTIRVFVGNKCVSGTYLSGEKWAIERLQLDIDKLEKAREIAATGGWPSSFHARCDIERLELSIPVEQSIYLPIELHFAKMRAEDTEVKYLTCEEHGKTCGQQFGKWVHGPDLELSSLGLKPGDRFIDNYRFSKFTFLENTGRISNSYSRRQIFKAINEETREIKDITSYPAYQRLPGVGDIHNIAAMPSKTIQMKTEPVIIRERLKTDKKGQIQIF